jgi:predicted metalloprotease with PDZ domain
MRRSYVLLLSSGCLFALGALLAVGLVRPRAAPAATATSTPTPLTLVLDAREAPRRILRARMTIPAAPGPLTLVYPKWLPGEHAPTGPVNDVVGLRVTAGGKPISWRRDAEDLYAFHLEVPKGARAVEVAFDFVTGTGGRGAASEATSSARLLVLKWNQVVLYPRGARPADLPVAARIALPEGWRFGTALPVAGTSGEGARFAQVSLETLVDSPLVAGAHLRTHELGAAGGPPHALHLVGDGEHALEIAPAMLGGLRRLVGEAGALFGGYPYRRYQFLVALSDHVPHGGLEHHESSDNRLPERALIDEAIRVRRASLLPHELVHVWNGKYRRPAGLVTPDFQAPFKTELLWVYEGLTTYLGDVLAARSGLRTAEQAREALAYTAAALDAAPGRAWRSLEDTAVAAPSLRGAVKEWRSYRRGLDYYSESALVWLEVDAIIRSATKGQRALDDFCRAFHGGGGGARAVKPYVADDVVAALEAVAPHDWRGFFATRVRALAPKAPTGGIERGGWRLAYTGARPAFYKLVEQANKEVDLTFSLGLVLKDDGTVTDVLEGAPAARAGIGPGMKVIAVGGRRYSAELLRLAVAATAKRPDLDLLVENADEFRTHRVKYAGGERYPTLVRGEGADLLGEILAPTKREGAAAPARAAAP